jgi:hypothetical protein
MLRKKNDVENTSPKTPQKNTKIKGVTAGVFISNVNIWRLIGCKKHEKCAQQKLYWLAEKVVDYSECNILDEFYESGYEVKMSILN